MNINNNFIPLSFLPRFHHLLTHYELLASYLYINLIIPIISKEYSNIYARNGKEKR